MTYDRWFGPITLRQYSSYTRVDRIFDVGGNGYSNLWMVGQRRSGSGGSLRTRGWIIQLQ
jgi:hypothetical protein